MDAPKSNYGPFHRRGEPGGPACRIAWLPIVSQQGDGTRQDGLLLAAEDGATEIELRRAIVSRLGIHWGRDELGWWAMLPTDGVGLPPDTVDPVERDCGSWTVWRQDDNGNHFVVRTGLPRDEAERVAEKFERRGHKQHYWVERTP